LNHGQLVAIEGAQKYDQIKISSKPNIQRSA